MLHAIYLKCVGKDTCIWFSTPSHEHSNELVPHNPPLCFLFCSRCRRDFSHSIFIHMLTRAYLLYSVFKADADLPCAKMSCLIGSRELWFRKTESIKSLDSSNIDLLFCIISQHSATSKRTSRTNANKNSSYSKRAIELHTALIRAQLGQSDFARDAL